MIISPTRGFAVFAPWKNASQTVHARLGSFNESPYDRFFNFNHQLNRVVHQHLTCADFAALPHARLGLFTAAFTRNPYDRVWSGFLQLRRDIRDQRSAQFPQPWIRDLVMAQLDRNETQLAAADHDFDRWVGLIREEQVYEAGHNTSWPLHPSHYWTHLAGRRFVDFIGRVENFETDFSRLLGKLSIAEAPHLNENVDGALADGDTPRYLGRMSRASLDRINTLFADDFELLGYARF